MDELTVFDAFIRIGSVFVPTLVALLYAFWSLWVRPHLENKKPFAALPMPPPSHWLVGHFPLLMGDFREGLRRVALDSANDYGQTGYWLGSARTVAVTHWQDVRAILHAEDLRRKLPLVTKHLNKLLGAKNIGVLQGREWKVHRAAIVRFFSPAVVEKSKSAMIEVTRTFVNSLREKIPVGGAAEYEVESLMKMITVDVFGLAAFSHRFECCENLTSSPVARAFEFLGRDMARRLDTKPFSLVNFFTAFRPVTIFETAEKKKCCGHSWPTLSVNGAALSSPKRIF
jgi:hypothetical protein